MSELYELPDGWEWKKLGNITQIIGGGTPKRKIQEYWENGDIVWLSPTDLGKIGEIGEVSTSKDQITQLGLDKSSAKLLPVGTVLYSTRATIGKIAINTVEVSTNQGFSNFICNDELSNKYLAYCLNRFTTDVTSLSNSTTFKEVSKSNLKEFKIPLPPILEQQRIVTKLDLLFEKIDKSIALHQKNMDEADVLMGSVLNDVFGELEERYGFYKLDEICKFSQGIQVPTNEQLQEYEEGLFKFIRIINYTQLSDEYRYIKNYSEKANVKEDDIVMVRYGATAGFIGKGQNGIIANNLFRVIPNSEYINDFIYYGIKNPKNQSTMYNNIGAAAMPAVNFGTMSFLTIPNISVLIQQKIVKYLDKISEKIEKIKSLQKEKMDSLKALKASILDRAFRGEL